LSVKASNADQSALPFREASRETTVIFSSFVLARAPRRDDPAFVFADRADDGDFAFIDISEYLISDFIGPVRPPDCMVVKDGACIVEVYLVVAGGGRF
jgi:hypothetical protein